MDDDRRAGVEAADGTSYMVGTEMWRDTLDTESLADLLLDGENLTIDAVVNVARCPGAKIGLTSQASRRLHQSRELKLRILNSGQAVYGVTTGFGDSVTQQISAEKTSELQRNLIRYHLNGTGSFVPPEMVRATLLIRANCLARGNSGVNPAVVSGLTNLIEHDVLPCIPERGSVGASGDLVPLCHLAIALIGEGQVSYRGEIREAADVLPEIGARPLELEAKDGLGLINGTAFSAAFAVMSAWAARRLAIVADLCTALASEATLGNRGHFHSFIHQQKPHPGQLASARFIAGLLADSRLALEHSQVAALNDPLEQRGYQRLRRSIQDRYSIRCAPHVTGVLRDTLSFVEPWLETEINSSNDNPLFDTAGEQVHSGGNFYGGHVVQAMDALKIATANAADLLDRQVELMVDEKFNNGLTPNLIPRAADHDWEAGLHHGFKGMQIACSAITAEALKTATPVSIFSRSTEAHNQDKVSMSAISARDAWTIVGLAEEVAAIHLLAACQALDLRGANQMSPRTRAVRDLVRDLAPFVDHDRAMDKDIAAVLKAIRSGAIPAAALEGSDLAPAVTGW